MLDEAQKIKNPSSATARSAFAMNARARLATTGTPIENHLLELWSLMNFLNPGLLGSQNSFRQTYLARHDDGAESERLARLRSQVSHFILRRRKQMVAPQLPAKLETVHRIDLSREEREFYNRIRRGALQMQKEDRISLLTALTRLRQACCDPAQVILSSPPLSASSSVLPCSSSDAEEGAAAPSSEPREEGPSFAKSSSDIPKKSLSSPAMIIQPPRHEAPQEPH